MANKKKGQETLHGGIHAFRLKKFDTVFIHFGPMVIGTLK